MSKYREKKSLQLECYKMHAWIILGCLIVAFSSRKKYSLATLAADNASIADDDDDDDDDNNEYNDNDGNGDGEQW